MRYSISFAKASTCGDTHNVMSILLGDDAPAGCAVVAKYPQGIRLQYREHGGRNGTVVRVTTTYCRQICVVPRFIVTCVLGC